MMLTAHEIQNIIRTGVPMAESIDFRVDEISGKNAIARIPFSETFVRPGGTLSGPIIMSLADASMYAIILATLGRVEMAVTSNLNINFLQRPKPEDLLAEATLLKLGSRIAFCEVNLYSPNSDGLVAHATGSYALPR
ncbi:hotdog fold thioesterase [Hahella sp. KA22]|uniref:PaaI family thioesterase n=1 Tax=Hahella sp. KA22 TaxID=1628392 RepID=UPI000FDD4DEE|nr:PaaI family thioesterase [Hahella sp. KA22]AZZ91334.1 PaaI family thioesterase [Hahella sp. KA22]QAY54703.1 hotdog fold thioesterase [Hahella sp. KA22]